MKKIKKILLATLVLVAAFFTYQAYRVYEYQQRDRLFGQCKIDAIRLYVNDKSDAYFYKIAEYIEECMKAGGYILHTATQADNPPISVLCKPDPFGVPILANNSMCYEPADSLSRLIGMHR